MSFRYFLLEGQNEDRAKIKLTKANKLDDYEQLLSITAPYKNDSNGKNNKHLPKLVDFYLEGQPLDIIKNYYDRFIRNTKTATKPIDNFNFHQFEQLVDSTATKTDVETKKIDDKAVYEDNNVKIYLGTDKASCIKYGQGRKYGFCIARTDNSNLFHGYRARGATFYFIYFKNREAQGSAPEDLIVIHAYPNKQYQINYATPNSDHAITQDEILNKFPALQPAFDQEVIKYIPFSQKEERIYNVIDKTNSILDLKTLDDQLLYIEMGKKIREHEWLKLKNIDEILNKYIEVGLDDIPGYLLRNNPKLKERYQHKLKQRVDIKFLNADNINFDDLTFDETQFIMNNDIAIDKIIKHLDPSEIIRHLEIMQTIYKRNVNISEKIISYIAKSAYNSYKYANNVLKWKNVPYNIYISIINDKQTLKKYLQNQIKWQNIPEVIWNQIIKSPDLSYEYAEYYDGKMIPDDIIDSIKKDPYYVYRYIQNILKFHTIPEDFLEIINNDILRKISKFTPMQLRDLSFEIATLMSNGITLSDEVINALLKNKSLCYSILTDNKNIPEEIKQKLLNVISDSFDIAYRIYKYYPELLNDAMKKTLKNNVKSNRYSYNIGKDDVDKIYNLQENYQQKLLKLFLKS